MINEKIPKFHKKAMDDNMANSNGVIEIKNFEESPESASEGVIKSRIDETLPQINLEYREKLFNLLKSNEFFVFDDNNIVIDFDKLRSSREIIGENHEKIYLGKINKKQQRISMQKILKSIIYPGLPRRATFMGRRQYYGRPRQS